MKNQNDTETHWELEPVSYFNSSVGFFELGLLDETEMELHRIDRSAVVDNVPVLALRLNIC